MNGSCVAILEDGLYGFHEHRHHYYEDENAISCECNDVILSFVETTFVQRSSQ